VKERAQAEAKRNKHISGGSESELVL